MKAKQKKEKEKEKTWHLLMHLTDSGKNTPYYIHVGYHTFKIELEE